MTTLVPKHLRRIAVPLCTLACFSLATLAQAGTIISVNSISGPGLGNGFVPAIITLNEGNDNQVGLGPNDNNQVIPVKRFDNTGYIDIEFLVRDSDPASVTEYRFFEAVDNNTGIDWNGYLILLGTGVGANFQVSPGGNGLDFDFPTFDLPPTSTAFSTVLPAEVVLTFSNGLHSSGSQIYEFRVDVPNGIDSFTLRQYPSPVPEPATLVLASGALIGLAAFKWRRR